MSDITTRPTRATPLGPGEPEEVEAVTGRPNDIPEEGPGDNSTFAKRAKPTTKRVATAENKAVSTAETKKTKKN